MASLEKDNLVVYYHLSEIVVAFDLSAFEIVVALDEIGLIREGPPYSFFSKYSWI
jgi:hypothetical protein